MRILFVINRLGPGGSERQAIELTKGLETLEGVTCELFVVSTDNHYPDAEKLKSRIHFVPRNSQRDLSIYRKLFDTCKRFKPDIVQSWEFMCSVYSVPVVKLLGIKFINFTIQNAPAHLQPMGKVWRRAKLTFLFSDVVLANSRAGLRAYNAPEGKSEYIHNGFDPNRVRNLSAAAEVRARFDIQTPRVIGMVATFNDKKDHRTYLEAAMDILSRRDDVTFLTVGDGINREAMEKLVKPEFRERIKFLGNQQDVESIVNIFDIGVLATYTEGISNAIMEYMALAKPVVATDGGGTNELVIHDETGFLVSTSNTGELIERLEYLLENPAEAEKLGSAGQARLEEEFSLDKMTNRFIELYRNCLNDR